MKGYNIFKRALACGMLAIMTLGLMTGCGDSDSLDIDTVYTEEVASSTEAMVIGDYSISLAELMVYAIQEISLYSLTPETIEADTDTYKDQTLSLIRETKILYDVALHNDVELGDSDLEARDELINNFKTIVPEEIFEAYGISDEIIEQIFTERTYVEKFENDIQNQMGQDITDDLTEAYEDTNFQSMYQLVFPTIEVDENDEPATDSDGEYVSLSDDEIEAAKENAEAALKDIKNGEDPATVAENYGVSAYSSEVSGYVGAYSDEMNELLADIEAGECTDVIEGSMGYTIIYMETVNDEDIKENYIYALANDYLSDQYEALRDQWLATIYVDVDGDMRGDSWENFDMSQMAEYLVEAGVVSTTSSSN